MLTGESNSVKGTLKNTSLNYMVNFISLLTLKESRNVVFMGSNVLEGEATGVVVQTGNNSVVGRLTQMATTSRIIQPVIHDVNRFVKFVFFNALMTAILIFILWISWLKVRYSGFLSVSGWI